jgi:hypothetical protein
MVGRRHAGEPRERLVHAKKAQIAIEEGEADRRVGQRGVEQRGEPREAVRGSLDEALARATRLFAYCYLGRRDWDDRFTDTVEQERLLALAEAGPEGIEGRVVSLALLSGYGHESLARRFEAIVPAPDSQK